MREAEGREEAGKQREKAVGQGPPYRPRWLPGRNAGHSPGCNTAAPFGFPRETTPPGLQVNHHAGTTVKALAGFRKPPVLLQEFSRTFRLHTRRRERKRGPSQALYVRFPAGLPRVSTVGVDPGSYR